MAASLYRDMMLIMLWVFITAVLALYGQLALDTGVITPAEAASFAAVPNLMSLAVMMFWALLATDHVSSGKHKAVVYVGVAVFYVAELLRSPSQDVGPMAAQDLQLMTFAFAAWAVLMAAAVYPPTKRRIEAQIQSLGVSL